jgi:uncharacterized protein involved in exopolysaccharide biosynthesis
MKLPETHSSTEKSITSASDMLNRFKESIDPIALVLLVFNKWWILVLTVGICSLITFFRAKSADYIYRAGARVEVFHESRFRDRDNTTEYDILERNLNRHIIIMTGEMFHRELISKLQIKWGDRLNEKELKVPFAINGVRGSGTSGSQSMIDLSVDSKNPEYALDYLRSILNSYRAYREREMNQINENALSGLRSEEERIQRELTKVKNEIEQFEIENRILIAQEREQMQSGLITGLLGRLQAIRAERLILEQQYKEIVDADPVTIRETLRMNKNSQIREFLLNQENTNEIPAAQTASTAIESTSAISWEEKEDLLASLEEEYKQKLRVYKLNHPKMVELMEQIDLLKTSLERQLEVALDRFQAQYAAVKRKETAIETAIESIQNENILSPEKENEYIRLKNHEAQMQSKYDLVYKRILESSDSIDNLSFITIQEPYIYRDPIAPNKLKLAAIGPIVGFMIGVVFILLKWFLIPTAVPILREYKTYYKASHGMI